MFWDIFGGLIIAAITVIATLALVVGLYLSPWKTALVLVVLNLIRYFIERRNERRGSQ